MAGIDWEYLASSRIGQIPPVWAYRPISGLKNNPSEALRSARDDVVVVMNRDQPDAVMIGLQSGKLLSERGARHCALS